VCTAADAGASPPRAYLYAGPGPLSHEVVEYLRVLAPPVPVRLWGVGQETETALRAALAGFPTAGMLAPGGAPDAMFVVFGPSHAVEVAESLAAGPTPDENRPLLLPAGLDLRREVIALELAGLYDLTAHLRRDCPWDRKQTQEDIVTYTLEETYELVDAVRSDPRDHGEVRGELGDLLFQVYFLACVAEQAGWYHLGDVVEGIRRKLVRRHPHIFGDASAETAEDVKRTWDQIKKHSEGREGIFHEVPPSLPSPLLARKLQQRAAAVGFDWEHAAEVLPKVHEELAELEAALAEPDGQDLVAREIGDVLFSVVNLARKLKVDPELELREASARFRARVEGAARLAAEEQQDFETLGLEAQESYYQRAKAELAGRYPGGAGQQPGRLGGT
jgi:MazG family protein